MAIHCHFERSVIERNDRARRNGLDDELYDFAGRRLCWPIELARPNGCAATLFVLPRMTKVDGVHESRGSRVWSRELGGGVNST